MPACRRRDRSPLTTHIRLTAALLGLVALAIFGASCTDNSSPAGPDAGTVNGIDNPSSDTPVKFIVMLEDRVSPAAVVRDHDLEADHIYEEVFKGFSGTMSEVARSGLLQDARVRRVVKDKSIRVQGSQTQTGATWGLDRIDQRTNDLDGNYAYTGTGAGVTVYVVDTGIRRTHRDFAGRVAFGFDAFGGDGSDCYGHGTHVAGTVGGKSYGVAKEVDLVSVRIYDCYGSASVSGLVAGLEWVLANARRPAVVNLSVIADPDEAIDAAVQNLIDAGIPTVAAAGNENDDACRYSPARVPEAITVGATTSLDRRTSISNYGSCVDWYAPGYSIESAGNLSDDDVLRMGGTSMATPHVTGAVALFLEQNPDASPSTVYAGLSSWRTEHVVDTRRNGGEKWGDMLYTLGSDGTTSYAPIADFGFDCSELTCDFSDRSADTDGNVVSWAWEFGTGGQESARNPTHTFGEPGTYTVRLTVTDNDGLTGSTAHQVTVSETPEGIQLAAYGYKVKGVHHVDLEWSGAEGGQVDVFRDGEKVAMVANSGTWTDVPGAKGNAAYTYRVCQTGTGVCSADVVVSP